MMYELHDTGDQAPHVVVVGKGGGRRSFWGSIMRWLIMPWVELRCIQCGEGMGERRLGFSDSILVVRCRGCADYDRGA